MRRYFSRDTIRYIVEERNHFEMLLNQGDDDDADEVDERHEVIEMVGDSSSHPTFSYQPPDISIPQCKFGCPRRKGITTTAFIWCEFRAENCHVIVTLHLGRPLSSLPTNHCVVRAVD